MSTRLCTFLREERFILQIVSEPKSENVTGLMVYYGSKSTSNLILALFWSCRCAISECQSFDRSDLNQNRTWVFRPPDPAGSPVYPSIMNVLLSMYF